MKKNLFYLVFGTLFIANQALAFDIFDRIGALALKGKNFAWITPYVQVALIAPNVVSSVYAYRTKNEIKEEQIDSDVQKTIHDSLVASMTVNIAAATCYGFAAIATFFDRGGPGSTLTVLGLLTSFTGLITNSIAYGKADNNYRVVDSTREKISDNYNLKVGFATGVTSGVLGFLVLPLAIITLVAQRD